MTTVTFESLVEGGYGLSLTDPVTGVKFDNPTSGGFAIDYSNDTHFSFLPSKYLTGGFFAPGNGSSLTSNFGFKATLPNKTDTFSMDMAYFKSTTSDSATIRAYDSNGNIVMTYQPSLTAGVNTPATAKVAFASPSKNIKTVEVVSTPLLSAGYDNMTFAPDPQIGCVFFMALAVVSSRFKRRW